MSSVQEREPPRVAVIGGGIAGLAAAHRLVASGARVAVYERADRPGGVIGTEVAGGFECALGPETFVDDEDGPLMRLAQEVGASTKLRDHVPGAKKRFVLRGGRPRLVPREVHRVLSLAGLIRAAREPFVPPRPEGRGEESVEAWATRRFGPEAAARLFDALVTGIYAGDPARLSIDAGLPRARALEVEHGSVVRGALGGGFRPRKVRTFEGGIATLTDALAASLGDRLHLGRTVRRLERSGERWTLEVGSGDAFVREEADAAILATPAPAAARMTRDLDPVLATRLDQIPYASVVSLCLGYDESAFRHGPPQGFGVLFPRREGLRVLGCLYSSAAFPWKAPEGHVLLRVLIGGRRDPGAVDLAPEELVDIAVLELAETIGLSPIARPVLARVHRYRPGIPQYEVGHRAIIAAIDARLARLPGLHVTGNAYRGVGVPDVVRDAEATARRAVDPPA